MSTELLVGVRISPQEKMNILKMKDVNLTDRSKSLKGEIAKQTNLPNDAFDLIYGGVLVDDETPLEAYGIKGGSLIHFLKKKVEEKKPAVPENVHQMSILRSRSVYQSFTRVPILQLAMRAMTRRPEVIENIISSSPGLSEDPVAIAILHDPDLLVHFNSFAALTKMYDLHPALLGATHHIASAVHEEAKNFAASANSQNNSNPPTSGHSYSLENLSEDEEMAGDSYQSSDSPQSSNSANQSQTQSSESPHSSNSANQSHMQSDGVTVSEFFAAIATARRLTPNPSGGAITSEMLNEAMQQAFANTSAINNDSQLHRPLLVPNTTTSGGSNDMQRQISIMHELGLVNDAVNLQALQVTSGDVQAAIELVLNGFGDN